MSGKTTIEVDLTGAIITDGEPMLVRTVDVPNIIAAVEGFSMRDKSEIYMTLRDRRSKVEAYSKALKQVLDAIGEQLLAQLKETGTTRATFEGVGTVHSTTTLKFNVEDTAKFQSFMLKQIDSSIESVGTPELGFTYMTKSVASRPIRDHLEELAQASLAQNPYAPGSLESGLPQEEQILLRMGEEAAQIGIGIFKDEKASVVLR